MSTTGGEDVVVLASGGEDMVGAGEEVGEAAGEVAVAVGAAADMVAVVIEMDIATSVVTQLQKQKPIIKMKFTLNKIFKDYIYILEGQKKHPHI